MMTNKEEDKEETKQTMRSVLSKIVSVARDQPETREEKDEAIRSISDSVNNLLKGLDKETVTKSGRVAEMLIARAQLETQDEEDPC